MSKNKRKKINYDGFGLEDLGITVEGDNTKNNNTLNDNTSFNVTKKSNNEIDNSAHELPNSLVEKQDKVTNNNVENDNTVSSNIKYNDMPNTSPKSSGVNQTIFNLVRNYLYDILGNEEEVQIKLKDIETALNINANTLYKHLKILRNTEFMITKIRGGTILRRQTHSDS